MAALTRLLGLLLGLASASVDAGLQLSATRVIYPEGARERTLELVNTSDYPVLVQTWVDDGRSNATPERHLSPIVALPAVFRLEPGAVQSLRLMRNATPLPGDRESLFWLNLLEIPPTAAGAEDANRLTMTLQTQLKVLYRPGELPLPSDAAPERQDIQLHRQADVLQVVWRNPTPYFMSLGDLDLTLPDGRLQRQRQMLAPYAEWVLDVPGRARGSSGAAAGLEYRLMDDRGTPRAFRRELALP